MYMGFLWVLILLNRVWVSTWFCKKVIDLKAFEAEAHEGGARPTALEQGVQSLLISLRKKCL